LIEESNKINAFHIALYELFYQIISSDFFQTKDFIMTLYAAISTDHSGSMDNRTKAAMNDFNQILNSFKQSAIDDHQDIRLTHLQCSIERNGNNRLAQNGKSVQCVQELTSYSSPGCYTRLYDSVDTIINNLHQLSLGDQNPKFIVMAITDGADNASSVSAIKLGQRIKELQATDRWTFVFRVPVGHRHSIASKLNIPVDNIQEWELSSAGMEKSSTQTQTALRGYTKSVAAGATSTDKFYANLDNVSQSTVKAALRDISQEVMILPVSGAEGMQIRTFVQNRTGKTYKKGAAFYQLTKTESAVQDYKKIIIRDKSSNAIYEGAAARDLLGVPHNGNIRLAPGKHGNYDIFIQSTSVNRSLDKNTQVIYWENFNVTYVAPIPNVQASPAQSPAPVNTWPFANLRTKNVQPIAPKTPTKKTTKRVRNRNTVQDQLRKILVANSRNHVTVKNTTNTKNLADHLGFDKIDLVNLHGTFESTFGKAVSLASWLKASTVGDLMNFLK
jgi:acyl carrier protein